jgi:hypothetical protein
MNSDDMDMEREHTFLATEDKQITGKFKAYVSYRLAHLAPAYRKVMKPVVYRYAHVFHDVKQNDFKSTG